MKCVGNFYINFTEYFTRMMREIKNKFILMKLLHIYKKYLYKILQLDLNITYYVI